MKAREQRDRAARHRVQNKRAHARRVERNLAAGLTVDGKPRKAFDRIAYLEAAVAEGATVTGAATHLGVEPLSIYQLCYRHGRTDLWYALKGDTVTWKRGTR